MKIEPRGKYAGVKVHLDIEDVKVFLDWVSEKHTDSTFGDVVSFSLRLKKKLLGLVGEYPNVLKERTKEEIQAALELEQEAATEKLDKIKKGLKWN